MIAAIAYLTLTSWRNRMARMARRLKHPRYALGFAIGLVYIWFFFFRNAGRGAARASVGPGLIPPEFQIVIAFGLFLFLASSWLIGQDRSALALTPAELQFLLPAPISRRAVLHFKLVRTQVGVLVAMLIWAVILRRAGGGINSLQRAVSLWALFSTISMHRLGATLVRVAAVDHRAAGARRNIVPMAVFVAVIAALAMSLVRNAAPLASARGIGDTFRAIGVMLHQPTPERILSPVMALLAPLFAQSGAAWIQAIWPALLILLAHYLWVARSNVAFEEAATEASAKLATRLATTRGRGRQAAPPTSATAKLRLPLAATGFPATALVWKNCVAYLRAIGPQSIIMIVWLTVMTSSIALARPLNNTANLLRFALPLIVGMLVIFGGRMVRNDLRTDLVNLPLLKTYPLDGAMIVGAEIAASTVVLSVVQLGLVLMWAVLFGRRLRLPDGSEPYVTAGLIATPLVLLLVNAVNMTVLNAAALLFPGWMRFGPSGAAGVEAIGQGMLTMVGSLIILALALIPAVIIGGGVGLSVQASMGPWSILPAALAAVLALGAEVALAIRGLGRVFERMDPSALV